MTPRISVLIASYNRAYILGESLRSLAEQSASGDTFEVIVVDNNSTDETEAVVSAFMESVPGLRLIKEPRQGAGYARNAGIAAARGDWIACLDSDGKAYPDWIQVILEEIDKNNFDCFGGPYYAWHHYGPPPVWFDSAWESSGSDKPYGLQLEGGVPSCGSCAFKKKLAFKAGLFPTDIGMKGEECAYGEETLLFRRMHACGARLGYVPRLKMAHCVLPYKYRLGWRFASAYARGRDGVHAYEFSSSPQTLVREVCFLCKSIATAPVRAVAGCKRGDPWQRIVLEVFSPPLSFIGSVLSTCRMALLSHRPGRP